MTQNDDAFDMELDELFQSAREATPKPSQALAHSIIHDAERTQVAPQRNVTATGFGLSRLRQFYESLGGWPALAGFSCAALFGIWIGGFSTFSEDILSLSSPEIAANADLVDPFSALDLSYFEENT